MIRRHHYQYFVKGIEEPSKLTEYNSDNTQRLNVDRVKEKLLSIKYVRDEIMEWEKAKQ
jgi:UDP-glucose 4-epimerase